MANAGATWVPCCQIMMKVLAASIETDVSLAGCKSEVSR